MQAVRMWVIATATWTSTICCQQMTHYVEDKHGVILHFDRDQPAVHAKLLVGADGYFSKVRSQCLDDGPPTFNVGALLFSNGACGEGVWGGGGG